VIPDIQKKIQQLRNGIDMHKLRHTIGLSMQRMDVMPKHRYKKQMSGMQKEEAVRYSPDNSHITVEQ